MSCCSQSGQLRVANQQSHLQFKLAFAGNSCCLCGPTWPMLLRAGVLLQVRVYTKKAGAKPDFGGPVILSADRGGTTVEHFCLQIHKNLLQQFQYALVWGVSSKHYPQR